MLTALFPVLVWVTSTSEVPVWNELLLSHYNSHLSAPSTHNDREWKTYNSHIINTPLKPTL